MAPPAPTARLAFRTWRDDDLPLARAIFGDVRVTALVGGPFDEAQIAARLATEIAMERDHGVQYWPIFLHDDTHVGCCGLRPRREQLELGFYVVPAHWGCGYAIEAARATIAHAFGALGARELFAGHHPDNAASRALLEKLGFRYTHHELYAPTGREHPSYLLVT